MKVGVAYGSDTEKVKELLCPTVYTPQDMNDVIKRRLKTKKDISEKEPTL